MRRPTVRSWTRSGARTVITSDAIKEYYPPVYAPSGIVGNLKFALRYEPIDLSVYEVLFKVLDAALLEEWIRQEPTGTYVRRAWFLYEALTGKLLDADDVSRTGYINILDPGLHVTGPVRRVRRQRVNNNLLGDNTYCPLMRRTEALNHAMAQAWTWRPSRWWRVASQRSWLGPYITFIQKRRSHPLRLRAKYPARSVPTASWPR